MLPSKLSLFAVLWMMCNASGHILKNHTQDADSDGNVIHCYCNLPYCITSSYMCKTEKTENGCFKRFNLIAEQYDYGCLDSTIKEITCPKTTEGTTDLSTDSGNYNQCCYSDMCNHDSSDNLNIIPSSDIRMDESDEEKIKELLSQKKVGRPSSFNYYSNSEIWFRAVLIAVPICGLMILLILIFVAIRMLRSDFQDDRNTSSKLLKRKYEIAAINGDKLAQSAIPETQNFRRQLKPKYSLFDGKFCFVFKHYPSEKNLSAKTAARYQFMPTDKHSNNLNFHVPKVPEKFARQNLNILKLPYKFNELKQKSCKNTNVNVSSNQCYSINTAVTLDSNSINYKKCNFTR